MEIREVKQFLGGMLDVIDPAKKDAPKIATPIMLIGATGIGKSKSLQQLAEEKGVGYIDLRLATQEVTDLVGIPRTVEVDGERRTIWTKPDWFPKEGTRGILALEEVNRAPEDVRQAIFQLLTEWKLHTHSLPQGWVIVSLVNPDNGNYHVAQLGPAFRRRFVQLVVTPPDTTEWAIWAKKAGIDERVLRFCTQMPQAFGKEEDIKIDAFPTRAGYEMLSRLMEHNIIPSNCIHEVASGILGTALATTFVQSLKKNFEQYITASQIFDNYDKFQKKYQAQVKDKRNDLIHATMVDVIATAETSKLSQKQVDNLCMYLQDSLPETLTTIVLRLDNNALLSKLSKHEDLIEKIIEIKKNIQDI